MTPEAGDYFVVATNGVVARLIRWFTSSWANHAGIYDGQGYIIEANPRGVQRKPAAEYDGLHIAWSHLPLSDARREQIVGAALGMVGIPYSFADIAALGLSRLPGTVGLLARVRLNRGDRLICSQLVARAYHAAGIRLVAKPDNFVTPGDLAALLDWRYTWSTQP